MKKAKVMKNHAYHSDGTSYCNFSDYNEAFDLEVCGEPARHPVHGLANVLIEVRQERERQDEKWGGHLHDDDHSPETWLDIIQRLRDEAQVARWAMDPNEYRRCVLQVAAVAVAAVEAHDRQRIERGGRA